MPDPLGAPVHLPGLWPHRPACASVQAIAQSKEKAF